MEIKTQRLALLPFTEEVYEVYSNQYEIGPHIEGHLKDLKENPELQGWGVWLAIRGDNGKPVGDLGFKGRPDPEGAVEVGYGIVPDEQNQGFATEAVDALIEWVFSRGETSKVIAECLGNNMASIKVLQKLGMRETGRDQGMIYWERTK
jgi:ribosomal-protein-alanine N-acetyltransferase